MKEGFRSGALFAIFAFVLTACAGGSSTQNNTAGGPIRIALMGAYAGQLYTPGADNAFKMAVDEINAAGGVNGNRKIDYKEFDVGATPQGGVNGTGLALQYQPTVFMGFTPQPP